MTVEETLMKEVEGSKLGEGEKKVESEEKVKDEEGEKKEGLEEGVKNEEVKKGSSPPKQMVVEKNGSFREESNFVSDLKEYERKALVVEKNGSFREESNFVSDLKEYERKALGELRAKLEEAILEDKLLVKEEEKVVEKVEEKEVERVEEEGEREKVVEKEKQEAEGEEEKIDAFVECEKEVDPEVKKDEESNFGTDVSIWGVPLLPSKGCESTDVILLKFLRARDFKVNEAFQMLQNTLLWRKKFNINSLLDEVFSNDLNSVAYLDGVDREGHPVCYNVFGVFANEELYQEVFGNEKKREQFLRWRVQVMEKGIQKLDFQPGGVSSLLQINDLNNLLGPSKKELRLATKEAVDLLQDNYPEFVARNIFINVPFWYYAFNALLSPFFTQRTKSKFVFARPSKVTETLLKYIAAGDIPIKYGGLKRENDTEFVDEKGGVLETLVKGGSSETIEIPAPEVGTTLLWDMTVLGGEVTYKEEFVPSDEGSYTLIVQKAKKHGSQDEPIRNSFKNSEPGKLVFTVENHSSKRKRVLYRYKTKKSSCV